ncbi:flagellar basal body L-ring protein FlgH [Salinicola rhizosphaerae]|uniref:Flagellar L-ring protein n=1 Tax=Salinicola rhizosphaerae TaxID=1443141 RepID=A0ABQ3DMX6_9GAMM|nr:flagellar basal body L-ring protein FlgH [Salinicola rhizosphaerae]GHB08575.1 flagellar L-ring protein [Salinicola rhizosphaerae]
MRQKLWWTGVAVLLLLVSGCAQIPRHSVVDNSDPVEIPSTPPTQVNGSIYQARFGYQPLFEDRRPRQVGDIITIVLDEQVSASKSSAANATRNGSIGLTMNQVPDPLDVLNDYGTDVEGENVFNGSGGANANNTFTGTITVTVYDVLANGNLKVRGEKQIAINQGTEYIRFSGVINPRAISGVNTVQSSQVADARMEYIGDGYINEAQTMGWLQRFFLNIAPF